MTVFGVLVVEQVPVTTTVPEPTAAPAVALRVSVLDCPKPTLVGEKVAVTPDGKLPTERFTAPPQEAADPLTATVEVRLSP